MFWWCHPGGEPRVHGFTRCSCHSVHGWTTMQCLVGLLLARACKGVDQSLGARSPSACVCDLPVVLSLLLSSVCCSLLPAGGCCQGPGSDG